MFNRFNSKKAIKSFIYNIISCLIYLLFLLICIFSVKLLWLTEDEDFTFSLIHNSFLNIIKLTSFDVHPFLYYFIAKITIYPFNNIIYQIKSLRILSALPYLVLLIIGNTTLKYKFGKKISILFMTFIIIMPTLTTYIYILRMYSFTLLFTTLVFIMFIYIYKHFISNSLIPFLIISLFSLTASFCHYYSLLSLSVLYLMFLILFMHKKYHIRYLIYSIFINIICYCPWLTVLHKQINNTSTYKNGIPISIKAIISNIIDIACPLTIHNGITHILSISFIVLTIIIIIINHRYSDPIIIIGLGTYIGTIILGILISILLHQNIIQPRYLMPSLGVFWFSIAYIIGNIKRNPLMKILIVLILFIIGGVSYTSNIASLAHIHKNNNTVIFLHNLPKKSTIIYDNKVGNFISAYHSHDIFLTQKHTNIYYRVYNAKIKRNTSIRINKKHGIFFARPNTPNKYLENNFYMKYKNRMNKYNTIYLPNISDNNMTKYTIYKFR